MRVSDTSDINTVENVSQSPKPSACAKVSEFLYVSFEKKLFKS